MADRPPRTDEQIKTDVVEELRWDSRVDGSKVQVRVDDGVARLTGPVPTPTARVAAAEDAWFVNGVTNVENQLVVERPSLPVAPDDATVRDYAANTLAWNADLDTSSVVIDVDAGEVTLTGTVTTHWEKERAQELVEGLLGVAAVRNELAVVLTRDIADEVIAEDIVAALERNLLVDAGDVDVTVSKGTVTLGGRVRTPAARAAAHSVASRTRGVVAIRNDMDVVL